MFHALAGQCADLLISVGRALRSPAWTQVDRALEQGFSKNSCVQVQGPDFSSEIVNFADVFVRMKEERHRADYDPDARFRLAETETLISSSSRAIAELESVGDKTGSRS